ncbi:hypothetical protein V5H41_28685, partial [Salmonella enterica]
KTTSVKTLPIPNHYGVDDFPVIIQDKRLDNFGRSRCITAWQECGWSKTTSVKTLPIPNHYGVDDFPVIIQDKRLDNFGR